MLKTQCRTPEIIRKELEEIQEEYETYRGTHLRDSVLDCIDIDKIAVLESELKQAEIEWAKQTKPFGGKDETSNR